VRRAPDPEARPGFIRIDSVHQGDWEGTKGLYHINAVSDLQAAQALMLPLNRLPLPHFLIQVLFRLIP